MCQKVWMESKMCLPARMIKNPHLVPECNIDLPAYLDRSVALTGICAPAIGKSQGLGPQSPTPSNTKIGCFYEMHPEV